MGCNSCRALDAAVSVVLMSGCHCQMGWSRQQLFCSDTRHAAGWCIVAAFLQRLPGCLAEGPRQLQGGLCIGHHKYNSCAYADDVTVFAASVPGPHTLINKCVDYAARWRIRFGIKKSKAMVMGSPLLSENPTWMLGCQPMETVQSLDILGVTFTSNGGPGAHTCGGSNHELSKVLLCLGWGGTGLPRCSCGR